MAEETMKEEKRKTYYIFSPFLRIFHWIMAISITVLFITGILITTPWVTYSNEPTTSWMALDWIRNIHFLFAYVFTASFILRIYGFIINRGDRLFPHFWKGYFYRNTIDVAMHYSFLKFEHKPFLRNPLARGAYATMYVLIAIEILTGFGIYYMTDTSSLGGMLFGWFVPLIGSEYWAHLIHHYVAWGIILSALGHIYMVIRAEFMEGEGEVSSMFAGTKMLRHEPFDAGHLDGTLD